MECGDGSSPPHIVPAELDQHEVWLQGNDLRPGPPEGSLRGLTGVTTNGDSYLALGEAMFEGVREDSAVRVASIGSPTSRQGITKSNHVERPAASQTTQ